MKNSSIAAKAFWDGFGLSGLFGMAKLPGGAETLVEETTDLSQSQFAELLTPFSKMRPSHSDRTPSSTVEENLALKQILRSLLDRKEGPISQPHVGPVHEKKA